MRLSKITVSTSGTTIESTTARHHRRLVRCLTIAPATGTSASATNSSENAR